VFVGNCPFEMTQEAAAGPHSEERRGVGPGGRNGPPSMISFRHK